VELDRWHIVEGDDGRADWAAAAGRAAAPESRLPSIILAVQ